MIIFNLKTLERFINAFISMWLKCFEKNSLDHILNNILVADVLYMIYLRYTSSLTASAEICQ